MTVLLLAAKAVIQDSLGRVLLLRESASNPDGTHAGRWQLPGGRLRSTETHESALMREVLEETGLTVVPGREVHAGSWDPVINGVPHHIIGAFFLCSVRDGCVPKLSGEHDSYWWVDLPMLEELDVVEPDHTAVLKVLKVEIGEMSGEDQLRLELRDVRHDRDHVTQERDAALHELAELRARAVPQVLYDNAIKLRDEARAQVTELERQRQAVLDYVAKLECGNCDHVHNDGGRCTVVREFTGPCRCDWGTNDITSDIRELLKEQP